MNALAQEIAPQTATGGLPAAAELAVAPSLRLVQHQPGGGRHGDGHDDEREGQPPGDESQQDQADDDAADTPLQMR